RAWTHDAQAVEPHRRPQAFASVSATARCPASAGALEYWSIPIACRQAGTNAAVRGGASIHRGAAAGRTGYTNNTEPPARSAFGGAEARGTYPSRDDCLPRSEKSGLQSSH